MSKTKSKKPQASKRKLLFCIAISELNILRRSELRNAARVDRAAELANGKSSANPSVQRSRRRHQAPPGLLRYRGTPSNGPAPRAVPRAPIYRTIVSKIISNPPSAKSESASVFGNAPAANASSVNGDGEFVWILQDNDGLVIVFLNRLNGMVLKRLKIWML
ncbi:unnamed protein product, partial [Iphiclides podalirius]